MSKTLVIGASENPERYSNMAIRSLVSHGEPVTAIGARIGKVAEVPILTGTPNLQDIDTVTLYVSAVNQRPFYEYIRSLRPRRVIFNPGTENTEFEKVLESDGIEAIRACTLVMLSTGQFR